jgi:S-(hydroxymethyl)glutathione dehydrogenase/alcohol dehydrogenase
MKTTAAILVETDRPVVIDQLEIPRLQAGQVLVEIAFSGVCHTQLLECRGWRGPDAYLPHCLGHEASGRVLEIGSGVFKCQAGDHVLLSWIKGSGANVPGTTYRWAERVVNAGGVTTFSQHAVVSENRVTVIPADFPLREAALIGCAVATGCGAAFNSAAPRPAQSVAVFGVGGVGLCAVAGAKILGATPVIAIDVAPSRLAAAMAMGATHTIDAASGQTHHKLRELCPQGLDFAIEACGRPDVMLQALAAVRSQGGTAVVIGNARAGERLELDPGELNQGKRLLGTWGGDNWPDRDFPRYCRLVTDGQLRLDPLLSQPYSLFQLNRAIDDLEARRVARPLIDLSLTENAP